MSALDGKTYSPKLSPHLHKKISLRITLTLYFCIIFPRILSPITGTYSLIAPYIWFNNILNCVAMKLEFWSSRFCYSCVGQFVLQIAPNQTITYVPALKPAPAFTWLKTDRRSSLLLCLRTVTTLANSLAAVSPTWSGMALCALCNASTIVATLLDAVLPMCGGSNTSDRGLFPDAVNKQKVILVEIFVILLENLTIVHVTSC